MRPLLALGLLFAPVRAPAAADSEGLEITEYTTEVEKSFSGPEPIVSADGYHFTTVVVSKGAERLYIDSRKVAEGGPGTYTRPGGTGAMVSDLTFQGALSRDGKVAAHAFLVRDEEGRPAYQLAINGTPLGRRYAEIPQIVVSPRGTNVAFVARTAQNKYLVVSAEGEGASVDAPEEIAGVADAGLVYQLSFGGRNWIYRNHKALTYGEYAEIAVTPDLSRIAGVTPGAPQATVEVNGKEFASAPTPLKNARIVFDSETEFHYLGDSLMRVSLVCGTIGGESSPRSACARHGEAIGKKDRFKLKAAEAAPAAR